MKKSKKNTVKIVLGICSFTLGWFIVFCLGVSYDGLTDNLQKSDVAVVFGNEIQPDGKPSPRLEARLQKAIQLYKQGFFPKIIVSGGIGKEGFDEAAVMKQYLTDRGIPENIIITDNQGDNTWKTVMNTKTIMDKGNLKTVMAISQFYHMSRIELSFAKIGLHDIATAHADYFELRDVYSLSREFPGYYEYVFINTAPD